MLKQSIAVGALVTGLTMGSMAAHANLLLNPGFETGTFANWNTSGGASIETCAATVVGCAPAGGTFFGALNNSTGGTGNGSITQTVILPGAGSYSFGAYATFGTNNAAGNFDQGQISLTVQIVGGASETVGFDPNSLNGQFTIPGGGGYSFTPWMLLNDTLVYSGVGPASAIINLNAQDFSPNGGLVLGFDNVFIEAAAVPEPATLLLLASGLLGFGFMRRRKTS